MVFNDRTLEDLIRVRPARLEDLLEVYGMGARKLDRYGSALLAVLAEAAPAKEPEPTKEPEAAVIPASIKSGTCVAEHSAPRRAASAPKISVGM